MHQRSAWGSLRAPSESDVKGRGGTSKGLQAAPQQMRHIVVLDFEWTCDNRRRVLPCAEITQFPSVLVRLDGRGSSIVDEFDTFVKPTLNPTLSRFATELTAITQADVDAAPPMVDVLPRYLAWLRGHGLADESGGRLGAWSFCTWSDADIGGALATELRHKGLAMPGCFNQWIDLKVLYRRRYKTEPRGGLRACVERLDLPFEGRAHNGLIDSRNTAKIVLHMARGEGMHGPCQVFSRPTRGLDANGHAFGSKASLAARALAPGSARAVGSAGAGPAFSPAPAMLPSTSSPFDDSCLPDDVLLACELPEPASIKRQRT